MVAVNQLLLDAVAKLAQTAGGEQKDDILRTLQPAYQKLELGATASRDLEATVRDMTKKLEGGDAGADSVGKFRQSGAQTDAQILKKVSTRLQDFEAQITAQLSNMQG